jgi:hypothetical protein
MSKNQYPGINPHLNSYLQHVKGWKGFHGRHITHIGDELEKALPDAYYIAQEESLQLSVQSPPAGNGTTHRTEPDILVLRQKEVPAGKVAVQIETDTPTLTLVALEESDLTAVVIYETATNEPVTRIELLSPANKFPGSHHRTYRNKRLETLLSGINLVEIDYLHAQPPVDQRLPSYLKRDENAFPYMILVTNPHPNPLDGQLAMYGFGVMSRLPRVAIPLLGRETVALDFGMVYETTFNSLRTYTTIYTDTRTEPARFEIYRDADQALIRQQMAIIAAPPPDEKTDE